MSTRRRYIVVPVPELKPSERRGIVFLNDGLGTLDALGAFNVLKVKYRRELLDRFDYWIGGGVQDRYFHGWPNVPEYKDCFVFKWKENRNCHRLYGFLYHPQKRTRPRFQLCVLISHAVKKEWETDPQELIGAKQLRNELEVIRAIRERFPDE